MPNLSEYIQKALEKGFSKEEITKILLEKGYSKSEIEKAINFQPKKLTDEGSKIDLNYFQKIKLLFSDPNGFFNNVKDRNIRNSIVSYTLTAGIILLIYTFIFMAYSLVLNSKNSYGYSPLTFLIIPIYIIILSVFVFALSFILSGASYLIIKLFKGEGNYFDTYNAFVYGTIPSMIISIVPFIGFLSIFYSLFLISLGISKYHNISLGKSIAATIIPFVTLIVLFIGFLLMLFFSSRMW